MLWSTCPGESDKPAGSSEGDSDEAVEMVKFNFNVESLGLVLYHNDPKQVSQD